MVAIETQLFHKEMAEGTGYRLVDTHVSCLLTRFRLRSAWSLLRFYRMYRRVKDDARDVHGLIATCFFIEDLRTCYTFSLWADPAAILEFNGRVHAHIAAANWSFNDLERDEEGRPQLWSAQFRLSAVSPHNLRWPSVVLESLLRHAARHGGAAHVS